MKCIGLAASLLLWGCARAEPEAQHPAHQLERTDLGSLQGTVGFGGPFVGTLDQEWILAGGANFPEAPPWEGGVKVWSDRVYTQDALQGEAFRLPAPRAYGATVSTADGVLLVGGSDAEAVYAQVWKLSRTAAGGLQLDSLPELPWPSAFGNAALHEDRLYALAGKRSKDDADQQLGFAVLDLQELDGGWQELPHPPTEPRIKAVSFVQEVGDRGAALHWIGGERVRRQADGSLERSVLQDAWRYFFAERRWEAFTPPPHAVMAGAGVAWGPNHGVVLGGVPAELDAPDPATHPGFSRHIQAYHTITDRWMIAGELPESVVTAGATVTPDGIVLGSGEIRPGVRTTAMRRFAPGARGSHFGWLDGSVLVVYLAALVGLGAWFSRREQGTADYFLAGRRIPWWAAGISLYATQLSAITYLATPAVAFAGDWRILPSLAMILAVTPIVVKFYLPFYRRLGVSTAYEYLERRFDPWVRGYGSLAFVLFQLGRMAVVVYLPALALAAVTGFDLRWSIVAMGVLATVYTVLGGMEAVIWTDVLQALVLLGGVILALVIAILGFEEPAAFLSTAAAEGKLHLWAEGWSITGLATWSILLGSFLLQFGPYTTDQAVVQRYMTTRDERSAARGIYLNGWMSLPAGALFFLLGTALYRHYRENPQDLVVGMARDEVFPLVVVQQFPVGLAGLLVAGVFAASMSSLDSSMHSIATAWTNDFQRKLTPGRSDRDYLRMARLVTVLAGVLGTLAAVALASFEIRSLFFLFQEILGLLTSGLVGVFFLGVFSRRASGRAVLAGALAGTASLAWVSHASVLHFYLYPAVGIGVTLAVGWGLSLLWPQRDLAPGLTWWDRPPREAAETETVG